MAQAPGGADAEESAAPPDAVSSLAEFARAGFQTVIGDSSAAQARRILLCSGKIYYDLKSHRSQQNRDDVAIVRIEQLYPVPQNALAAALERYPEGTPAFWVQEEPINIGAACFWSLQFGAKLLDRFPLHHNRETGGCEPRHRLGLSASRTARKTYRRSVWGSALMRPGKDSARLHEGAAMRIEIKIPNVGESISEVAIGEWFKRQGESVTKNESLLLLETDKASMEIQAPESGTLVEVLKENGESASIGEVIARLETKANGAAPASASEEIRPEPTAEPGSAEPPPPEKPRRYLSKLLQPLPVLGPPTMRGRPM